jgi:hypothetical protein
MLGECAGLLYDIVLHTNISDSWVWRDDTDGGYSVRVHMLYLPEWT